MWGEPRRWLPGKTTCHRASQTPTQGKHPKPSVPQTLLFSNQSQSAQLAPFSLKLVPPGMNPDGALLTTQSDQPGDPPQMTPREPERQALSNRTKQMTNGCAREKFFSDVGLGVRSLSEIKGERDEDARNELEDAPPPRPKECSLPGQTDHICPAGDPQRVIFIVNLIGLRNIC